ncbi:hypothetical protein A3744_06325 [Oleiphilus sp. HI0073]|nr:hypothetical protein A3744_06325 [Oleiphilus sp. HI0073]
MANAIVHRGPDSHGLWLDENSGIGLGHRRLAIQDLSAHGHQPMQSQCARYQISFNGEIYNFLKLKQELSAQGAAFTGSSDTEVLIEAIVKWGLSSTLAKLEGMFAFALWDMHRKQITLCRDRLGEKPLYYGWLGKHSERFAFASELKSLEAIGSDLQLDSDALSNYFYYGYVPAPMCIYSGIYKLMPGTYISFSLSNGKVNKSGFSPLINSSAVSPTAYWSINNVVEDKTQALFASEQEAIEGLDHTLKKVIADQSLADVPLGAFLSGGIDSSTVVAIMQQVSSKPTQTYTIGFDDKDFNEASFARDISAHLGTHHHELYIRGQDCLDLVPSLSSIYDEPIADSSQIPTYLVSKLARENVTVCLSGDGGDELFAGYNRYIHTEKVWSAQTKLPIFLRQMFAKFIKVLPPTLWNKAYSALARLGGSRGQQHNVGLKVQKIANLLECGDIDSAYRYLISYWQPGSFPLISHAKINIDLFDGAPNGLSSFIDKAMYWDQLSYLPGDNLTKVDRASMAVSLETRLPLLNHRVVEFAWQTPLSRKIKDGQTKWLLRQVLYKYVPKELIERPKMGFSVPVATWLRGPLREWAEALINDSDIPLLDKNLILKVWNQHQSAASDNSNKLWALLMFLDWYQHRNFRYIEKGRA